MTKESKIQCFMVVQYFSEQYWKDWDVSFITEAKGGDIAPLLNEMVKRISEITTVSEAYGIIHDKDEEELYDVETQQFYTKPIDSHGHLLFKLSEGMPIYKLADVIGIEPQYIEKAKRGRYGYDNLLSYLIHSKESNKYQYAPQEVVSAAGKNYMEVFKERFSSWKKGRIKKDIKLSEDEIDNLILDIIQEKIGKSEILLDEKYHMIYTTFKTRINEAFAVLGEIKGNRTKKAIENGEFKKTVLFIHGRSGLGKTRFAKELASKIQGLALRNGQKWDLATTAGTNIMDDLNGEEILLLDDVRGESLTASDWLKLLDNYNISFSSARYKNILPSARIIIVTSTKHPLEFFYKCKDNEREDLSQFIRRFDSFITLQNCQEGDSIQFFQASPRKTSNVKRKIPNRETIVTLNHDFEKNNFMNKDELVEFLLAQVSLNNKWELEQEKSLSDTFSGATDKPSK